MEKLTAKEFANYMKINIGGWNAKIGFWWGFYYEQYKRGIITLETALEKLRSMHPYDG